MQINSVRHLIANFRRHYNFNGDDILACYDTAVVVLGNNNYSATFVTISISPSKWKALSDKVDLDCMVKHPCSGVPCIRVFKNMYVRSEVRVDDSDVVWSAKFGCYAPTVKYLLDNMERITMSSKSTKKQVVHAGEISSLVKAFIKNSSRY